MTIATVFDERVVNRALLHDLEVRLGARDLFLWIDEEAEGLGKSGLTAQCVDFTEPLCRDRRIVRITERKDLSGDASLEHWEGQFTIYYKRGLPPPRMRFAIAHEIGHTYWFQPGEGTKPLSPLQS